MVNNITAERDSTEVLVAAGLEDPQHVALDAEGNLYVSDRGDSHQVKVFDPAGKPLRVIGTAGPPKAGPYNPLHMNNPNGLTVDGNGHLWVAETDFQPKRVSVWTLDGRLVRAFYGPAEYGGGGTLDPRTRRDSITTAWSSNSTGSEALTSWCGSSSVPAPGTSACPTASAAGANRKCRSTGRLPRERSAISPIVTTAIRPTAPAWRCSGWIAGGSPFRWPPWAAPTIGAC